MKRQAFTPESLFRVSTLGVRDPNDDPYVAIGAHLRAWVNPAIGFPLRGLSFFPLTKDALDPQNRILVQPLRVFWWEYDDNGTPRPLGTDPEMPIRPDRALYGDILGPEEEGEKDPWISWIRLDIDEVSPVQLSVVGRFGGNQERVLLSRSQAPFALAASRIRRIRLTGEGIARNVIGFDASQANREYIDTERTVQFDLPLEQTSPWADPVIGFDGGMVRVVNGAPRRTGPPDVPPDIATTSDDEIARVSELVTDLDTTSVMSLLEEAYSDGDSYPGRHRTPLTIPGDKQQAKTELGTIETLITAAADPGIARWLGLSSLVDADISDDRLPVAWIAVGVWATDPTTRVAAGTPNTTVADIVSAMNAAGPDDTTTAAWVPGGTPIDQPLLTALGLRQLPLVTPVAIGALPDRPARLSIAADGQAQWVANNVYRQDIAILGPPPAGPIAFTRSVADVIQSQHAFIDINGTPRALAMLPGRRELAATGCQGALIDSSVPADAGQVSWQVAEGDEFGRWGPPGVLDATPPARPLLPLPRPEAHFFADYDLRDDAPPGALSPGTITVEVDVPPPDALGPGTPPITQVSTNGITVDAPFPGDRVQVSFPAIQIELGAAVDQAVTVTFNPNVENRSTTVSVHVVDPRRPEPLLTAPRILWSSRRDPVGTAQIELSWPTAPGHAAYNVYLADEQIVTRQLDVFPDSPNRATRAAALHDHQHQPMKRESFTLLTPVPLPADGTVRFAHRVPGSLQTLQFVRVVPLTQSQVEAPFDACGLTPVAVPSSDQPPAPAVLIGGDDNALTVQVEAHGIHTHVIDRLGSQSPPEYRVRCATAAATSYLYGTKIDEGQLATAGGEPGTYRTAVSAEKLSVLPAFVALAVTAQVRYPAEVSTEPGAAPLPSPITTAGLTDAQPCEWSAPSAPVSVMVTAPMPDLEAVVQRNGAGIDLTFDALPTPHAQQIAPWRLQLWRKVTDGELQWLLPNDGDLTVHPPTPFGGDGWELTSTQLHILDVRANTVSYVAVLVNPLGKEGHYTDLPSPMTRNEVN